jgi:hypothetical protein
MDRPWFRFGWLLLVTAVITGCASGRHTRRFSSSVFRSARHTGHAPAPRGGAAMGNAEEDESAAVIVERLHAAGFHFGTDGSPGALWGYLRTAHQTIPADEAGAGDIVFFDTRSRDDDARACGDRVGVVERVDVGGRLTFVETRAGQPMRGYVDPREPLARRSDDGQVLNSFLRPKKIGDPPGTRHFAGEMLCGVARVRWRR